MKTKLVKFVRVIRDQMRHYSYLLIVFLVVMTFPLQACAAMNYPVLTSQQARAGIMQAQAEAENGFVMVKPGVGYVISWLTKDGRCFAFAFERGSGITVQSRAMLVAVDESAGRIKQFIDSGWELIPMARIIILTRSLMDIMPTIWLMPVTPEMNLDNWLKSPEIQS
jgi:hypothetical protein